MTTTLERPKTRKGEKASRPKQGPRPRKILSTRRTRSPSLPPKSVSGTPTNGALPPGRYKGRVYPRPASFWEKKGVYVKRINTSLQADEKETAIGWMHVERLAEVTTAEPRWMQRIESLGYKPEVINVYRGGGEIRVYDIPKRHILLPSKQATISKADLDEVEKAWGRRVKWESETAVSEQERSWRGSGNREGLIEATR